MDLAEHELIPTPVTFCTATQCSKVLSLLLSSISLSVLVSKGEEKEQEEGRNRRTFSISMQKSAVVSEERNIAAKKSLCR